MERLKKVEHIVEKILDVKEDARENDDILYLYVCEYLNRGVSSMTLKDFLEDRKLVGCPAFETVRRTRQKVFEKRPELKPKKVTKLREEAEEVFMEYALN